MLTFEEWKKENCPAVPTEDHQIEFKKIHGIDLLETIESMQRYEYQIYTSNFTVI